jgi:hypothetical protein
MPQRAIDLASVDFEDGDLCGSVSCDFFSGMVKIVGELSSQFGNEGAAFEVKKAAEVVPSRGDEKVFRRTEAHTVQPLFLILD